MFITFTLFNYPCFRMLRNTNINYITFSMLLILKEHIFSLQRGGDLFFFLTQNSLKIHNRDRSSLFARCSATRRQTKFTSSFNTDSMHSVYLGNPKWQPLALTLVVIATNDQYSRCKFVLSRLLALNVFRNESSIVCIQRQYFFTFYLFF